MEPEWGAPDSSVMFFRSCDRPSHLGRAWGWDQPHCLLIASFSESSFLPICPLAWGTRWGGWGAVRCYHTMPSWTRSQQQPGVGPGRSRPESASPLCHPHQYLVEGTPKPFWEGLQRKSSLGPHKAGSPPHPSLIPQPPQKHSLTHRRFLRLLLPASPPPSPFFSGPVHVTFALGFLSRLEVPKRPSRGIMGASLVDSCRPHCLTSLSGRALSWAGGLGLGPESSLPASPFPV